eukprot:m.152194 g.152194  ORF g.152194 m.152194 type:complete len:83 (+) comp10159_c5_seq1:4616-4864(+)
MLALFAVGWGQFFCLWFSLLATIHVSLLHSARGSICHLFVELQAVFNSFNSKMMQHNPFLPCLASLLIAASVLVPAEEARMN